MHQSPLRLLATLLGPSSIALLAAAPATAQVKLFTFHGDDSFDQLGDVVAAAGDVNGDGVTDVIAGAYRDEGGGSVAGLARVWSGADGTMLWNLQGSQPDHYFGWSVDGAGDVDGDGKDDLIVGARYHSGSPANAGNAYVISGATAALLHTVQGERDDNFIPGPVAGVGDVDLDGFDDFAVGEPVYSGVANRAGRARVYSGATGLVLFEFLGAGPQEQLGRDVAAAGDVNQDGRPDVIVGGTTNPLFGVVGNAWVYSGLDGSLLHHFTGPNDTSHFGDAVSGVGDVDGDGSDDVAVGAPLDSSVLGGAGSLRVYSGATGATLYTFDGPGTNQNLGSDVAPGGDYDGDGFDDVLVGLEDYYTFSGTGAALLFSGADGSVLRVIRSFVPNDAFGTALDLMGDVSGDGRPDYVFGAWSGDVNGQASGNVYVLSIAPPFTYYCATTPNSTGAPAELSASGHGSNVDNDLTLTVDHLPPGGAALFFYGQAEQQVPLGNGFLCIAGSVVRMKPRIAVGATGTVSRFVDVNIGGNNPFDPGTTWKFQCWYRDPGAGGPNSNLSNAVSIDFLP